MALTKTEEQTIRNVIKRLKCEPRASGQQAEADCVRKALRGEGARLYMDTWVIPALEMLLPGERRNPDLAQQLSEL